MNAISAAEKVTEKKDEKVEKRRALGRGLASLLPGPRVVAPVPASGPAETGAVNETIGPRFARDDNGAAQATGVADTPTSPHADAVVSIHTQPASQHAVTNLAVELIDKNPYQTRYVFQEEMLNELADSIRENGVVQPVVVRPSEEPGRFVLVLGERRLRAVKIAGMATIPAIVRRVSPQQAAEMTVLENVQRQDLNPLEQAEAFRVLSKQFNLTQAQIAERIGVSRETVANYMRLLRLPEDVMKYMLDGRLSFSDARAILALDHEEHIRLVANEVVARHLKWDQIDQRVRELNGLVPMPNADQDGQKKAGGARWVDPNVRAAQMEVERILGLRVMIKDRNGKGKIVIEYGSVDEYERVVEVLQGKSS